MTEKKNELVVFDEVKAEVAKFQAMNAELEFDYADPEGEKAARSHVFKLRGVKTKIMTVHKTAKAEALAYCQDVDKAKRFLIESTEEMIDVHMKPIEAIQDAKQEAEMFKLEAERAEKERLEQERLDDLNRREEEAAAKEAELQAEEDRIVQEREKLEAAKLAEEDAQRRVIEERERAEIEKKEAIEKAERDKIEAAERAEREKQEAIEAEKEKARQAEADRIAKEEAAKAKEAKRIANKRYQQKIRGNAIETIKEGLGELFTAEQLVAFIDAGHCTYLVINY